jgi:hypothetical protein
MNGTHINNANQSSANKDDDVVFVLRTAHQNQIKLVQMADQKANILVGLIVIPLTLLGTRVLNLELTDWHLICIAIFTAIEVAAVSFAVMVIRPRTLWVNHNMKIDEIPNPLFFGYFTRFSEDEYVGYMNRQLTNNRMAREMLLKDIYQIGQVLKRKFMLLKAAYFFAITGLVFAIGAFLFFLAQN